MKKADSNLEATLYKRFIQKASMGQPISQCSVPILNEKPIGRLLVSLWPFLDGYAILNQETVSVNYKSVKNNYLLIMRK